MVKNNIRTFTVLNKLHEQEAKFKRELAKTFLEYLETLPTNKRIEQVESVLYETNNKSLLTLDRRLTPQERKCLLLASKGKEIKEMAGILGLSQRTVKYHRANITKKLEVPNLMAAVAAKNKCCNTDDNEFLQTVSIQAYWINIVAKLPGHVYWKDEAGIYREANDAQAIFLGYKSGKDLIGKTDFDFFPKEQAEAFCKIDKQVMKTQKEYCIEEIGNNHEGIEKIFLSRKIPFYDESKKIIGIIGTSLNITANKKAELAKQDFLMQMAHDLKNPLDLLSFQAQKINKSNQLALLQSIHDTSGKLLELINSMVKPNASH